MKELFASLKETWGTLAQIAAWIITIAGSFIMKPPVINYSDDSKVSAILAFVIAALLALLAIPLKKKSTRIHYQFWQRLSWGFFLVVIILLSLYYIQRDQWTINYFETPVVIGSSLSENGEKQLARLELEYKRQFSTTELVMSNPDKNETLWFYSELRNRFAVLAVLFMATMISAGGFIISAVQAISCFNFRKRRVTNPL